MARLDEREFDAFYQRTARALWSYVYRTTGHATDADDIVQDAFCRLLRVDLADTGDEALRRYLFRIAGNLMTDRWRRTAREQSWLAWFRPQPSEAPPANDDVARTFATLRPRDRALLWLAYVEDHDHQQIAESLGLARGSVKVMLSRARARLRDLLKTKGMIART